MSSPQPTDLASTHAGSANVNGVPRQMRDRGTGRFDVAGERPSDIFDAHGSNSAHMLWTCSACNYNNDSSLGQCMVCRRPKGVCEERRPTRGSTRGPRDRPSEYSERVRELVQQRRGGLVEIVSALVPGLTEGQGLISGAITASVTATFALVGAGMGAVAGAMAGRATDSGVLRGLGLGAIAGAVVTVEAIDATRSFLRTTRANGGAQNLSEMVQSLNTFLDERWNVPLEQEQSGVSEDPIGEWQVDIDSMTYDDMYDLFGGRPAAPGVPPEAIVAMSKCVLDTKELQKRDPESICAICLNCYEYGQALRVLPGCQHEFHQMCVDRWLYEVGRCPVCRNEVPYGQPGHADHACDATCGHSHHATEAGLPEHTRGEHGYEANVSEQSRSGNGAPPSHNPAAIVPTSLNSFDHWHTSSDDLSRGSFSGDTGHISPDRSPPGIFSGNIGHTVPVNPPLFSASFTTPPDPYAFSAPGFYSSTPVQRLGLQSPRPTRTW